MIIESIAYIIGLYPEKRIKFDSGFNLIHSSVNAQGKTTLLRIILFALGYDIPDSKGLVLDNVQFSVSLRDSHRLIVVDRHFSNDKERDCSVFVNGECVFDGCFLGSRVLIQKIIFQCQDENLLMNLLGVFYIDQEKGWTLLNRGKVIGGISFNVERFLCALGDVDISVIKDKILQLNSHINEYRKLKSFVSVAADSKILKGNLVSESKSELQFKEVRLIEVDKREKERQLSDLLAIKRENKRFLHFIEKFSLRVVSKSGEIVPVNQSTLLDFAEHYEFIQARIDILKIEIAKQEERKNKILTRIHEENAAFEEGDLLAHYKRRVRDAELNSFMIQEAIDSLEKRRNALQKEVLNCARNSWSFKLNELIRYYLAKLSVMWEYPRGADIALTHKLAAFSGSEMTKRVLAFRFAFLKSVNEKFGLKLPVIIDSPYAKEFDGKNFSLMMSVLQEEFSEHQVIMASIYDKYMPSNCSRISLNGGVWEGGVSYSKI